MEVDKILHMKEGFGEHSYAKNSSIQKIIMSKANQEIEQSVKEVYQALLPESIRIVDFGCSSGPNSLTVVSDIIDIIDKECQRLNRKPPQFEVFLNDLPGNDFNGLFSLLPRFYQQIEEEKGSDFGPCFVSGTPRSFYGQVFANESLHFVHSSNSIHWLSQVPQGLTSKTGEALNKGTIHIAKTSPPEISQAYTAQFKSDFTLFLSSRAKEMVCGGGMVLTFGCSKLKDDNRHASWLMMDSTLLSMVSEGLIEKEQLDQFNMPYYAPTLEEVGELVKAQGSFNIKTLETFAIDWKSIYTNKTYDNFADIATKTARAATESLFAMTFSEATIDELFLRFKLRIKEYIAQEGLGSRDSNLMVSLIKKD